MDEQYSRDEPAINAGNGDIVDLKEKIKKI